MVVWKEQNMCTNDNKPVAHATLLNHAWNLATQRTGKTYLFKVRAHRKDQAEISILNNQMDQLAKEAAGLDPMTAWKAKDMQSIHASTPFPPL